MMSIVYVAFPFSGREIYGGYCGGVPPLPIPNRAVKPACADGTAMQCGRVGGCRFFEFILEAGVPDRSTRLFLLEGTARKRVGEEKEENSLSKGIGGKDWELRKH